MNHFAPERYDERLEAGELPIARQIGLPGPLGPLYWMFWQAYAGRIDLAELEAQLGPSLVARLLLAALEAAGWMVRDGDVRVVTARGRDAYHDLERWVTYHYIEPLWAELMAEHQPEDHAPPARRRGALAGLARAGRRLSPLLPG